MTRLLTMMAIASAALLCASCGDPGEGAIEAAYYDMEAAFNSGDGATALALYSADSFATYDALLKHALDSDETTVKTFPRACSPNCSSCATAATASRSSRWMAARG